MGILLLNKEVKRHCTKVSKAADFGFATAGQSMAKNVKLFQTQKKQAASRREFVLHQLEGFASERNVCWYSPPRHLYAFSKHLKKIILRGIYMHAQDGIPSSALDYISAFSFDAMSVLLPGRFCHRILTCKCLVVPGQTVHVKAPPLSVLLVTYSSDCTWISIGTG